LQATAGSSSRWTGLQRTGSVADVAVGSGEYSSTLRTTVKYGNVRLLLLNSTNEAVRVLQCCQRNEEVKKVAAWKPGPMVCMETWPLPSDTEELRNDTNRAHRCAVLSLGFQQLLLGASTEPRDLKMLEGASLCWAGQQGHWGSGAAMQELLLPQELRSRARSGTRCPAGAAFCGLG
jgi:hypothetical protein